jgi:hypothetical protein
MLLPIFVCSGWNAGILGRMVVNENTSYSNAMAAGIRVAVNILSSLHGAKDKSSARLVIVYTLIYCLRCTGQRHPKDCFNPRVDLLIIG